MEAFFFFFPLRSYSLHEHSDNGKLIPVTAHMMPESNRFCKWCIKFTLNVIKNRHRDANKWDGGKSVEGGKS